MTDFMQKQFVYDTFYIGETTEGTVVLHPDIYETEKANYRLFQDERWESSEGWYARLSAPGYMDCTDWSGPFRSEQEAEEFLCEMYDGDLYDGDPIDDE